MLKTNAVSGSENEIANIAEDNIKKNIFHRFFEIGITFKLIDGILEILGGFILLYFDPARLNKLLAFITQHELSTDPKDAIANYLINFGHSFSLSAQHFGVFYLLIHGIFKITIYVLLLKGKKKAYIFIAIALSLFIIYQLYRFAISGSIFMLILSLFDTALVILTLREYKHIK